MHVCPEMHRKCQVNQRSGSTKTALKHYQKLIKYMDYSNKYFHKIWGKSHEQFVRRCAQVLRQSEEDGNSTKYDQILIRSEDPLIIIPTSLSKMHGKCMANQKPG